MAALPQFEVDPEELRAGMKALPRDAPQSAGVTTVLGRIKGGAAVLETLRQAREQIAGTNAKGRAAAQMVVRFFGLDMASRPLQAVLEFIANWETKAITKTKELAELLEYLEYFREAGGGIPLTSREDDAVALMTAHTAKGLEWDHVFILRATSSSFPCGYKAPLFEFPAELREDEAVSRTDVQTLHDQEERRLFYVAMTRARDSLTMYAQQGRGKKDRRRRDIYASCWGMWESRNGFAGGMRRRSREIYLRRRRLRRRWSRGQANGCSGRRHRTWAHG